MNQAHLIFAVLALVAIVSAAGVVLFDSPVRAALSLVLNFFTLALMYFTLQAQLLGIVQILVYTGAIMVLFLFVIMLLNLGGMAAKQSRIDAKGVLAILVGAALFGLTLAQVVMSLEGFTSPAAPADYGTPQAIGNTLFSAYVWPFEVASVLLLVGIVGSILLAKRRL
jgi:NADH-quinone oxidoreductase subunit J